MRGLYPPVQRAMICIWDPAHERIVGAGLRVGQSTVLTCAHVVQLALGEDVLVQRGTRVDIGFLFSATPDPIGGTVTEFIPRLPYDAARHIVHDCALIQLDRVPPGDVLICEFTADEPADLFGADVVLLGFPGDTIKTSGGSATITAIAEGHTLELQRRQGDPDVWVRSGFSGAPLWRKDQDKVLGMVQFSDEKHIAYAVSVPGLQSVFGQVRELAASLPQRRPAAQARAHLARRQDPAAIKYYLLNRTRQHGAILEQVRQERRARQPDRVPHCFCLIGTREDELQQFTDRLRYHTLPTAAPELEGEIEDFEVRFEAQAQHSTRFARLAAAIQIEAAEHLQPPAFPPIPRADAAIANAHLCAGGTPSAFVELPAVAGMVESMSRAAGTSGAGRMLLIRSMFEQSLFDRALPRLFPYWRAFWTAVIPREPGLDVVLFVRLQLATGVRGWLAPSYAAWCEPSCGLTLLDRPGPVSIADLTAWIDDHVIKDACYPPDFAHHRRRQIEKRCDYMKRATMQQVVEAAIAEFNPELHAT